MINETSEFYNENDTSKIPETPKEDNSSFDFIIVPNNKIILYTNKEFKEKIKELNDAIKKLKN